MFIYKLLKNIIPPIIFKIFNYFIHFYFLHLITSKKIIKRNSYLKKKRTKDSAFLIATGPSLKKENLKLLKGQDCFTLSNAFLLNEINTINPLLHFFAPHHAPISRNSFYKWLIQSDKKLPKKTDIVMSYDDKSFKNEKLYKSRNIFYLKISKNIKKFHTNIKKPLPKFQTGSLMVLPVLINMGYKKIYLLGCDHNQLKNFNSKIDNFYSEKKDLRFTTGKNKLNSHFLKLDKELKASLEVYNQYLEYKKIAKDMNVQIINLSKNSWIDIFNFNNLKKII